MRVMKPESRRAQIIGALWRLPLGIILVIVQISMFEDAFVGREQLQFSAMALGYWLVWALAMYLGVRLVYRSIRCATAALGKASSSLARPYG